jgi:EpsI family protein
VLRAAGLALAVVAFGPIWVGYLERPGPAQTLVLEPPAPQGGWHLSQVTLPDWQPVFQRPSGTLKAAYEREGRTVGVFIAFYSNEKQDATLVTSQNVMVIQKDKVWQRRGETMVHLVVEEGRIPARRTLLRSVQASLVALDWYWIGGIHLTNPYLAKLVKVKERLIGSSLEEAGVVVYTPVISDDDGPAADRVLTAFVADMLPSIDATLHSALRPAPKG